MPYVPGAFDGSDSNSDDGIITYTPPASDKHLSPEHKHADEVHSRNLFDLEEEISLCRMSMEAIDREDPDYAQITQRLQALHGEYQKTLDDTYDIKETMGMRCDAQTPSKQPLPINKKTKKWNTVKMALGAAPQTHDKPVTEALSTQSNAPRTFDELYNAPWSSFTEPEKARLVVPLSQGIGPKTGRKFDNKAASPASIPTLSHMMKARSAPLVNTAAIAKPKNKPIALANEDNDYKMQQHKGKKWSTVKVKSTDNNPQAGSVHHGSGSVFKNPGFSRAPNWVDQVSPELKTFKQVQDQMRGHPQQQQVVPADSSAIDQQLFGHLMGLPYGRDAPPYVLPTPDPKAVAFMEQFEELAKTMIAQRKATGSGCVPSHEHQVQEQKVCDNWWGGSCGECSNCTSADAISWDAAGARDDTAREQLSEDHGCVGWNVGLDIPKSTSQEAAVDVKATKKSDTKKVDSKKPEPAYVSMSPDAFMIDEFAEVTDYVFTREEAFEILRMCGANLDVAISMFRNGGGASHLKKMLDTWLSPTENDDATDKAELRGQAKASGLEQEVYPGCEDCEPGATFDPKEDYFRCCFCGHCFNVKHGDACMECGEELGLYLHHTVAKTTSEHGFEIPENLVTGWGTSNKDIDEGLIWDDLPEDKVNKPATNTGPVPDVEQAFAILGLGAYNSVDLRTLREHFTEVLSSCGHTRQLVDEISSAFDTVVKHHDANGCWKLSPTPWSKLMDIKLMALKEDPRITWNAVAQELGMSSEECKERFRAIKPKDWKPSSASKGGEWGTNERGPKSDCGDDWDTAEVSTGDPWSRSVPQYAPSVSAGDCWDAPVQHGVSGPAWSVGPDRSSQQAGKASGGRSVASEPNYDAWCATGGPVKKDTERNDYSRFANSAWGATAPEDTPWPAPSMVHEYKLPQPKAQALTAYTVTYWATIELEHGEQSIHIPIDGDNVCGPEKAIVEGDTGMKKVWKWVQEKGLRDKISFQDAFDLAKDMHCNDEDEEPEPDEEDNLRPTSPAAPSRCSSPGYTERRAYSVDSRCYGRDEHVSWCTCG
jgi:hypothetical protein